MTRWYVDTSAAAKLMVEESESGVLAAMLDVEKPELAACFLLETELRRLAQRVPNATQSSVSEVLDGIDLYEVPPSLFREAGLLAGVGLRSLDAVHLAAAMRIGVDAVLAYDHRLIDAARSFGFDVVHPGM